MARDDADPGIFWRDAVKGNPLLTPEQIRSIVQRSQEDPTRVLCMAVRPGTYCSCIADLGHEGNHDWCCTPEAKAQR